MKKEQGHCLGVMRRYVIVERESRGSQKGSRRHLTGYRKANSRGHLAYFIEELNVGAVHIPVVESLNLTRRSTPSSIR